MLTPAHRVVLLQHGGMLETSGKTGKSMLRYSDSPIVAIIDQQTAGKSLQELTGMARDIPIVGSFRESLVHKPDVLVIGIAPSGGLLPEAWYQEIKEAVDAGLSIVNGLHTMMGDDPQLRSMLREGQWIWDVRREPKGLGVGKALARELPCLRVLTVGMDMAVGKMSTSLELHRICKQRGLRSKFLATGQTGLMLMHDGVPLDAIRLDFASGSIEGMCMQFGHDHDILHIEGQGSLFNPASTAPLPLMRGSQATHMILVHRAGQKHIERFPYVHLPPLREAVELYETVSRAAGSFAGGRVAGIALNTGHMEASAARDAVQQVAEETGLPCVDPFRENPDALLDAILATR